MNQNDTERRSRWWEKGKAALLFLIGLWVIASGVTTLVSVGVLLACQLSSWPLPAGTTLGTWAVLAISSGVITVIFLSFARWVRGI